jgi:hypothetical protein
MPTSCYSSSRGVEGGKCDARKDMLTFLCKIVDPTSAKNHDP